MADDELTKRLRDEEDNFVERKSPGVSATDIRRAVVGFANSVPAGREAILFIGIGNKGAIEGCPDTDGRQKDVRRFLAECYPPIAYRCEVVTIEETKVLAVVVPSSSNRPHFAGPAFVRQGSESVTASEPQFDELIRQRSSAVSKALKIKDQVVTVTALQHQLGQVRRVTGSDYRESAECRVLDSVGDTIQLEQLNSGRVFTEGLERVQFLWDDEKNRPRLVVVGF
jgi:predicted HTH transcriptional regulator